jgi:hypothetical protein
MGRTDTAGRVISASPDGVFATLTDSDVVDGMGGHPVDARSRVDIRADDVPDGSMLQITRRLGLQAPLAAVPQHADQHADSDPEAEPEKQRG